ncbi:MAG: hypothetical protein ABL891_17580 [Burkholderiales bacterium]
MKKFLNFARTAGIIYLQFAIFSAAVLWLWLGDSPWETHARLLPTIPGAVELLTVIVILMVASVLLGTWLTVRAKVNLVVLGAGVLVAIAAIWWNILAMAFWIAPLPFMLLAYKREMTANRSFEEGRRKSAAPLN